MLRGCLASVLHPHYLQTSITINYSLNFEPIAAIERNLYDLAQKLRNDNVNISDAANQLDQIRWQLSAIDRDTILVNDPEGNLTNAE